MRLRNFHCHIAIFVGYACVLESNLLCSFS